MAAAAQPSLHMQVAGAAASERSATVEVDAWVAGCSVKERKVTAAAAEEVLERIAEDQPFVRREKPGSDHCVEASHAELAGMGDTPSTVSTVMTDMESSPSTARATAADDEEWEESTFCPPKTYLAHLDITRICCVWIVAVDHGDWRFGKANSMFGQDWVLQYLWIVCGVCFGISKKPLWQYELRLAVYFLIGVAINFSAWVLAGKDWRKNPHDVIFHLWFIFGLMLYSFWLAPLRMYLEKVRKRQADARALTDFGMMDNQEFERQRQAQEHNVSLPKALAAIGGGALVLQLFFRFVVPRFLRLGAPVFWKMFSHMGRGGEFWGLPQNAEEASDFLARLSLYHLCTWTNVFLIIVCPKLFQRASVTVWFMLLNVYGNMLFCFREQDERPWHGLELLTIGLAAYYLGVLRRRTLGLYMVRYWPVVVFVCTFLWPVHAYVRYDEVVVTDLLLRIRVGLMEAIFVVMWLVAGERILQKEIFTEDRLTFLNDWALLIFLVHKAVHILVPSPWSWVLLVLLAPACYLRKRCAR